MSTPHKLIQSEHDILASLDALLGCAPERLQADGRIHRFGPDQRCWYFAFESLLPSGERFWYCQADDWANPQPGHIVIQSREAMPEACKVSLQRRREQVMLAERQYREEVAEAVARQWSTLSTKGTSRYLTLKGIRLKDPALRFDSLGALYIPVRDMSKKLWGYQKISVDPADNTIKRFRKGTMKTGNFHLIGTFNPALPLIFVEGYATGASIHQATDLPVIVCFDAGNIAPVLSVWRSAYPHIKALIAGDDDRGPDKSKNTGREAAQAAAERYGAACVLPDFAKDNLSGTDFNDLMLAEDVETVARQIMAACQTHFNLLSDILSGLTVTPPQSSEQTQNDSKKRTPAPHVGRLLPQEPQPVEESQTCGSGLNHVETLGATLNEPKALSALTTAPHLAARGEKRNPNLIGLQMMQEHRMVSVAGEKYWTTYRYNGRFWQRMSQPQLESLASRYDSFEDDSPARRQRAVAYLQAKTHQEHVAWQSLAPGEIPFENGVLCVKSGVLRPHRAEDYLETVIPHAYHPEAACPQFHAALSQWFPEADSEALIEALGRFMGYLLLPHARFKTALVLYGPSHSGKTLLEHLMRLMVGEDNTCSLALEAMNRPMDRYALKGKLLNLVGEIPYDALVADAGFKALVSTGEPVRIEQKFRDAELYTPIAKHVFATNHLPKNPDLSDGVYNRLLLLPMMRVFEPHEQDRDLLAKLQQELPGIVAWAVQGAQRLVSAGGAFAIPERSQTLLTTYKREQNDMFVFASECLTPSDNPKDHVPIEVFRDVYRRWNPQVRLSNTKLTQMAKAAGLPIDEIRRLNGDKVKALWGYRLS